MRKRVLVAASETALRAKIARLLQPAGYAVDLAASERRALELLADQNLNTAVVAPGAGLAGLAFVRQLSDRVPRLIVLAERSQDIAKLSRSLSGVDIHPTDPLDERKLLDRLAQLTASSADDPIGPAPAVLKVGDCRIDLAGRSFLRADGGEVALTRAEFSLLMTFARNPGRVLSRDQLSRAIAGHGAEPYGRGVDVQIGRLRRKIEPDPKSPRFIITVSGGGYKFVAGSQVRSNREPAPAGQVEATMVKNQRPADAAARVPYSEPERRLVTVLSCELVGSPELAANNDPEDLAHIIQGFQTACAAAIARMGGSIVGTTGHELVALFGYPKAHEDDAERAAHAGLDLAEKLGAFTGSSSKPLQVRMGIATGLVVVSGDSVIGAPSTLASRLRNVAMPNAILVSPATRKLLGGRFICSAPLSHNLAGSSEKLKAVAITGRQPVANRFNSMRGPRLTQFVGRQLELQQLLSLWRRAKAAKGQVALLCGEAGIGKSRICDVFLKRIAAEPHTTIRYQCAQHNANSPFFPIIDQLERLADFQRGDAPDVRLEKLERTLSRARPVTATDLQACAALLSIPAKTSTAPDLTPRQQKDNTVSALIRQIQALATNRPLVIELADAHWADSSTLELFSRIITSIGSAPVFVLVSFRPDFYPQWLDEPNVTMMRLDRLGREHAEAMMLDIAGRKVLAPEMHAQIISKTDGVPLFVEELTKSVLESEGLSADGGDRRVAAGRPPPLPIPATLFGSLTARLDRLGAVKEIAQIGAAIGREFSYRLLAAVAPLSGPSLLAALAQLAAPELIFVRGEPPDSSYVFKHALVQDAAYSTLVRGKRQQLHRQIADALEEGFPETVETQPELLAHHLVEAGLTEQAINYLRKAGQRAIEHSANSEAIQHLKLALELLQSRPDGPARTRVALGLEVMLSQAMIAGYGYAARETAEVLLQAKAHIDDQTDPPQKLAILYGVWASHYVGGEVARQSNAAREFLEEAERHSDAVPLCVAHRIMGTTHLTKGELAAALPHLERARALYEAQSDAPPQYQYGQDVGASALCYLSLARWLLGSVDQGTQLAADAVQRAQELSHPHTQAFTICHARGMMDLFRRRSDEMRSYAGSVISLCSEHGLSHWIACGHILEGWAATSNGEVEQGIELLDTGVAAWRRAGARLWLPLFLALEAEAHAKGGRNDAALDFIEQAIEASRKTGELWFLAEILRIKAALLSANNQADPQIEASLTESLDLARHQQARCWELRAACDLALRWQSFGRAEEAKALLQPVYAQFTEGFDATDMRHAKDILDSLQPGGRGKRPPVCTENVIRVDDVMESPKLAE